MSAITPVDIQDLVASGKELPEGSYITIDDAVAHLGRLPVGHALTVLDKQVIDQLLIRTTQKLRESAERELQSWKMASEAKAGT